MIERLGNHQRQAPGLEGGQQMASGKAGLTVYEYPSGLIRPRAYSRQAQCVQIDHCPHDHLRIYRAEQ